MSKGNFNIIGFNGENYTLWVACEFKASEDTYMMQYKFIKNLTSDIEQVKNEFPDVKIDMSIKGNKSFRTLVDNEVSELRKNNQKSETKRKKKVKPIVFIAHRELCKGGWTKEIDINTNELVSVTFAGTDKCWIVYKNGEKVCYNPKVDNKPIPITGKKVTILDYFVKEDEYGKTHLVKDFIIEDV